MIFANLSGGRDSTAMIVRALEMGIDVDFILFCDLGFEFSLMYEYIEKLDLYLKQNFNKKITTLDCRGIIEKWAFVYPIVRGEKKGRLRGLPREVGLDYCTREGKARPIGDFVKKVGGNNAFKNKIMIGYTADEVKKGRIVNLNYANAIYPLADWGWNEQECESFLRERGIANPLYKHFKRTGCYFCPHQNKQSLFNLWKYYPQEWEKSKALEMIAKEKGCLNTSFKISKSLSEYQKEFKKVGLLDFGDDSYQDSEICFCK